MNHGLVSLAPGDGHFEEDDDDDFEDDKRILKKMMMMMRLNNGKYGILVAKCLNLELKLNWNGERGLGANSTRFWCKSTSW